MKKFEVPEEGEWCEALQLHDGSECPDAPVVVLNGIPLCLRHARVIVDTKRDDLEKFIRESRGKEV